MGGTNEIPKLTYEELEKENETLKERLKYSKTVLRGKEEAWDRSETNYKERIKSLLKEIKNLKEEKPKPPQEERPPIYTYTDTPFNKLANLLEKNLPHEVIQKELGDLQRQFSRPVQFLTSIEEMTSQDKDKINRYNELMDTFIKVLKVVKKHSTNNE